MTKSVICLTCGLDLADEASDCECDVQRTLMIVEDDETGVISQTAEVDREVPCLHAGLRSYVIARTRGNNRVLLGGLGALGVGEMWVDFEERHTGYPGWDEAPFWDD